MGRRHGFVEMFRHAGSRTHHPRDPQASDGREYTEFDPSVSGERSNDWGGMAGEHGGKSTRRSDQSADREHLSGQIRSVHDESKPPDCPLCRRHPDLDPLEKCRGERSQAGQRVPGRGTQAYRQSAKDPHCSQWRRREISRGGNPHGIHSHPRGQGQSAEEKGKKNNPAQLTGKPGESH